MPAWVDECLKEYLKKGYSKEEAWRRCQGAYEKRKKKKDKKSK